ncbi:uncharacterized protein LOC128953961 [Oppia nitens]|uniref:uncharacterized protein LOC128953961 n=1 Tax=Oppia nitens TaxID=1686743 RepID=UPI0023DC0C05|nr:uncharacterized protein LOC128953961 [Oppia nitens]
MSDDSSDSRSRRRKRRRRNSGPAAAAGAPSSHGSGSQSPPTGQRQFVDPMEELLRFYDEQQEQQEQAGEAQLPQWQPPVRVPATATYTRTAEEDPQPIVSSGEQTPPYLPFEQQYSWEFMEPTPVPLSPGATATTTAAFLERLRARQPSTSIPSPTPMPSPGTSMETHLRRLGRWPANSPTPSSSAAGSDPDRSSIDFLANLSIPSPTPLPASSPSSSSKQAYDSYRSPVQPSPSPSPSPSTSGTIIHQISLDSSNATIIAPQQTATGGGSTIDLISSSSSGSDSGLLGLARAFREEHREKQEQLDEYGQPPLSPYAQIAYNYPDWSNVGKEYQTKIPKLEPLPLDERKYVESKGIEFKQRLGKGGYGSVYQCKLNGPLPGRLKFPREMMAVKILSLSRYIGQGLNTRTPYEAVKKMTEEYRLQRDLFHTNIVTTVDMLEIRDTSTQFPCIRHLHFMELCNGNLRELLKQFVTMAETDAKQWFRHICYGLRYLHGRGIRHMDIKCMNILYKGQYPGPAIFKLADYGMASEKEELGGQYGTRRYMAPEINDQITYQTMPCDIWSLGMSLCETLGGVDQQTAFRRQLMYVNNTGRFAIFKSSTNYKINTYEFCRMILTMVEHNPTVRATIEQIINCDWFTM